VLRASNPVQPYQGGPQPILKTVDSSFGSRFQKIKSDKYSRMFYHAHLSMKTIIGNHDSGSTR